MKAIAAQVRAELTLTARNGEQFLVNLLIPLGLLVLFSKVKVLVSDTARPVDFLAPAVLALAVMSSALVSLGISTGFERYYKILKRLGTTPLGRGRWIASKVIAVLVIELAQWAVLIGVALVLGWSPDPRGWVTAVLAALAGTAAFGGLALLMAGTLSGMANLAVCNGLYLVLMVTGGMVIPLERMPGMIRHISEALPAAALAEVVIGSLRTDAHVPGSAWPVLLAWAVVAPAAAAVTFRWD
ncbi:MAG: ABC transporter permease [Microthrixaceae bacterium]